CICLITNVLCRIHFLTGSSVSTVTLIVSVKQGGSITIPCLYNQRYRNNVKYWCRGYYWSGCSTVVRTDHPKTSGKTSISDDINQRVFTVTMTSLSPSDSDYYWCIVDRKNEADDGVRLHLLLQVRSKHCTPELYVDQQELSGVVGWSVTVLCYYSTLGGSGRWCRMGRSCVAVGRSRASDGTSVKLVQDQRKTTNSFVLTVNMSGLRIENTGWYWCEKGDLFISLAESNTSHPTVIPSVTNSDNGVTNENTDEKHQSLLEVLLIPLSLLVVLIAGTLVTWKMLRKHKDKKAKDQPPNTSVVSYDHAIFYLILCISTTIHTYPKPTNGSYTSLSLLLIIFSRLSG
uniref:Immunoglobulin domain-containing protein n=1 Tax=Hucho hucho TaxID=62062 RepID=A0A4W5J885_9TELE